MEQRWMSLFGLFVMLALAWLMSSHKKKVELRIVLGGLFLQFVFALLILKTTYGRVTFDSLGDFFNAVLSFVDEGSAFLFNVYPREVRPGVLEEGLPATFTLWRSFAFGILPTIIFFSAFMSILYHLGIMQFVVRAFAVIMQKTLGTSGAETLSAAANVFVGQTEAPLVIRPFVGEMTLSELNVVMVGGFATIAGGVLAAYVGMGIDAGHLLTASVISAPAALMIAKIMQPETEQSKTVGVVKMENTTGCVNVIEAAAEGASSGLSLALNVGAMLIAFVALVAMGNAIVGWVGGEVATRLGYAPASDWSLQLLFGYVFCPLAWLMGIPWDECTKAGGILGTKMVLNEFVAYADLASVKKNLSPRTVMILTYALCGFANFSSIGIQLGGIGGIAPERRSDLARLGFRAMLGGTLAAFMTACVAGVLITDDDIQNEALQKANALIGERHVRPLLKKAGWAMPTTTDAGGHCRPYKSGAAYSSSDAPTALASASPINPSESESTFLNISAVPRNSRLDTSPSRLRSIRTNQRGPSRSEMLGTRPSALFISFWLA